jgi:hypothetical protein
MLGHNTHAMINQARIYQDMINARCDQCRLESTKLELRSARQVRSPEVESVSRVEDHQLRLGRVVDVRAACPQGDGEIAIHRLAVGDSPC